VRESLSTRSDLANAFSSKGSGTKREPAHTIKGKISMKKTVLIIDEMFVDKK
jgi:hypothetical protein